jgi:hypothetical protein
MTTKHVVLVPMATIFDLLQTARNGATCVVLPLSLCGLPDETTPNKLPTPE